MPMNSRKGSGAISDKERSMAEQATRLPCPSCPNKEACLKAGVCMKRLSKAM